MITTLLLGIRSLLFYIGFVCIIALASTLTCLLFFLPFRLLQQIATSGNYVIMLWLRVTCGIKIKVSGSENLPSGPCVILSNHQSSWEAFYMQWYFQPASFILKRELLWIPFFGWALYFMRPIAIRRSKPSKAIRWVLKQGTRRLQAGNRIVIYPEGTRIKDGKLGVFKTSGAALAKSANVPVVPVAHNAGEHWKQPGFTKIPGTIYMKIGPAIDSVELSPREMTEQAHSWVKQNLRHQD